MCAGCVFGFTGLKGRGVQDLDQHTPYVLRAGPPGLRLLPARGQGGGAVVRAEGPPVEGEGGPAERFGGRADGVVRAELEDPAALQGGTY